MRIASSNSNRFPCNDSPEAKITHYFLLDSEVFGIIVIKQTGNQLDQDSFTEALNMPGRSLQTVVDSADRAGHAFV